MEKYSPLEKVKHLLKLENIFVLIVLFFGTLFAVFTPPNEVPDEDRHFARVYGFVTGNFISTDVTLPAHIVKMLSKYHPLATFSGNPGTIYIRSFFDDFSERQNRNEKITVFSAAIYNPILYLPQIFGLVAGMFLKLSDRWSFLLGRIFSVIFYVSACYYILKTTPVSKRSLFVLFAMPMAVYSSASYSADMMQNVLSFLYLYMIITATTSSKPVAPKEWWKFLLLSALLALTKPISLLLPLVSLAIPVTRFGSDRKKIAFIASQYALILLIALVWAKSFTAQNTLIHPLLTQTVSPSEQLVYVFLNPIATIRMIFHTIFYYNYVVPSLLFYLFSIVGWFGWMTAPMPDFVYFIFLLGLTLAILGDLGNPLALTRWQKTVFLSVFLLYVLGIIMSMFIFSSPVGKLMAEGIQGRYFIPIIPLLLYLSASLKRPEWGRFDRLFTGTVSVIVPVVLAFSFQTIFLKYFVGCGENYYSITSETCVRPLGLQTDNPEKTVGLLDRPYIQTFISECNNLSEVAFYLTPYWGKQDGYLDIKLRDLSTDTIVFERQTFAPKTNGKWKEFSFPPVTDSWNHPFSLTIAPTEDPISAASLGLLPEDVYPEGELLGAYIPGDLVFKYTCRTGFLYRLRAMAR